MSTPALVTAEIRTAVAAAKVERTVRNTVLADAIAAGNELAISDARHDVALIGGILSTLQRAYRLAAGLEVN